MPKPKPSTSYTGTIHMKLVDDKNGSGTPNWGDTIAADITTDAPYPFVKLVANSNDSDQDTVGWSGYWDGALNPRAPFALYSGVWKSGPAECRLELWGHLPGEHEHAAPIASFAFHVDG